MHKHSNSDIPTFVLFGEKNLFVTEVDFNDAGCSWVVVSNTSLGGDVVCCPQIQKLTNRNNSPK